MAQATSGFPWHGSSQEQPPVLSEKVADNTRNDVAADETHTENPRQSSRSQQRTQPETKKLNGKSRKRASSVKGSHTTIPQTREELDERLSYGPSRHFNVRTIPPWVRDAEEDDVVDEKSYDVLDSPHTALVAQHNSNPASTLRAGRQSHYPTSSGTARPDRTSRWITFARASAYPRENFNSERVDAAWLDKNFTDYSKPWLADHEDDPESDSNKYRTFKRKRKVWYKRLQIIILRNPFVPLAFRLLVITFAIVAMALGATIFRDAGIIQRCRAEPVGQRDTFCIGIVGDQTVYYYRDPSGLMAVIVDAVAIVYSIYITYDEYFSKPLGLRPAKAKVRLVLLDLFFIVFQSANLSLAFESLTVDQGACSVGDQPSTSFRFDRLCDRAEALSAVLLVSLVAWLFTFSISILRLVERINAR